MFCVGEEESLDFQQFALMFCETFAAQDNNEKQTVQNVHAWIIVLILGTYKNFTHLTLQFFR